MAARAVNGSVPGSDRSNRPVGDRFETCGEPAHSGWRRHDGDDRETARTPAGRHAARADDRDHSHGHLERFLRGRRARVRDLVRGGRGDRQPDDRGRRLEGRPGPLARSDPRHRRGASGRHRDRPRLGRRRGDVASCGAAAHAGFRSVGRPPGPPLDADRPDPLPLLRPDARPRGALCGPRPEHHRQVPRDHGRRPGDGGGDLSGGERQRDRVIQRRAGRRGRRGRRARASTTGVRGSAGRRHGTGHHGHDGSPGGLASRPIRARRHRRRPDGHPLVRCRGLQAHRRRIPGTRPSGAAPGGGDPPPSPLVGADRWRRRHHLAGLLAASVQRVVRRGPAPDGRPGRPGHRRRASGAVPGLRPGATSPTG